MKRSRGHGNVCGLGRVGLLVVALLAWLGSSGPDARGQEPLFEKQVILDRGDEPGAFAIPKLLVTSRGVALLVVQDRAGGDWGKTISPIVVRSVDGGRTWSAPHILYAPDDPAGRMFHCKPTGIVEDRRAGRVFVFISRSPLRNDAGEVIHERWFYTNLRETRRLGRAWFLVWSDDDGATWSPAAEITDQLIARPHWQEWSPVHKGIQLERGPHAGRLVVPIRAYCPERDPSEHDLRHQTNGVIYSDDDGRTWTPGGRTSPYHGECSLVELAGGDLYLNNRQSAGRPLLRTWSISRDGGVSFTDHGVHEDLADQHCHAGLVRYDEHLLLLSNVPGRTREGLAISGSRDEGTTWTRMRVIEPGPAAYSSLAVTGDGTILCVYETGATRSRQSIAVARFDLAWLAGPAPARRPRTIEPVPSTEDRAAAAGWRGGGTWRDQHEAINRIGASRPVGVAFVGDSITQSWGGDGRDVWAPAAGIWSEHFGDLDPANFGISGDRTQHVLWRIDHGNFDRARPRVIVLLIGTNNLPHDSPEATARGIEAIVERLAEKAPQAQVLLLGILPRGERPDAPMPRKVVRTNELIRRLGKGPGVTFLDIAPSFLGPDGHANPRLLRDDFLHLTVEGYRVMAEAIAPRIHELARPASRPDRRSTP